MRIRTQFIITMLLFGIILVVMVASAIITNQRLEKASNQERLSAEIAEGASELSYLTDEYLIYRESRQLKRWQSKFASFSEQAANLKVDLPQQQALVRNLRGNQSRLKEVFDSVISALEGPSRNQGSGLDPALLQISWSRMAVQGRELVSDASRLSQMLHQEMDQLTAARNQLLNVMLALFGVFLLSSYMLTYRRILQSIAKLQTDTKIIGAGNLEFKTDEQKNDEIGDLARAFNQMTVNLKTVTASKADLEREIADRKQAEEALRKSEAKYRNLFENMTEEVHFWQVVRDETGRIKTWRLVDVNPPTLKSWGRNSVDEIRGKTTDEIFGPGARDHYMPVVQKIMTEGVPYSFEDYLPNLGKYFRFTSVPMEEHFITTGADITDIKKAYEALRASEERWAVTLSSIGDAVIASDTNGRVSFVNPVAEKLTGWSLAEAAGKPVQEVFRIVNEHTRAVVDDPVSKVLQTGLTVGLANHTVLLRKGGGEIPVDDSGAPIRDKDGRILGVVLVFRDIAERKRAEEELRRLSQFPEENPNPVLRVTVNAELLYANAPARDWLATLGWQADRPLPVAVREVVVDAHEKTHVVEKEIRISDSITFWICAIQPPGENYINLYGIETTERKRAEEKLQQSERRYRSFIEVTSQWAWVTDASGQVVEDIPALRKFTGQTYEQAKGAGWAAALHPDDRQRTFEVWNRAVSTKTLYEIEYRMRRHDGVYRHLLARGVPILDEQGHVVEWVGTCVDITERKQIEEELRQLNLSLEQRVVERTSEVAHTVEVLQGEIEQRIRAESELKRANEQLAERADQLRRLAGQLTMTEQAERKRISKILHDGLQQHLVSAKLQIGGLAERIDNIELKQETDEIEKMIADSVSMSRSLSAELSPPVLFEGSLSDGLGWLARWMRGKHCFGVDLSVEAVPELREDGKVLLFESVRELLFNALKHAQTSSARVSLERADGGGLRLIVSDEGVGFDPNGLNPAGPDGGFGLFSIRERISLFGGRLEIESAPGEGSRFTLNVPYCQAVFVSSPADDVGAQPGSSPKRTVEDESNSIRLLLVDDHALFRNGVVRLLKREPGLKIVGQASDGQEAIELAQKLKPDVILMDISMPGINGIDATRTIHQENPEISIIGLSMHEDLERSLAMRDAGAADFKTKGCTAAELLAAIRDCVQKRQPLTKEKPHQENGGRTIFSK